MCERNVPALRAILETAPAPWEEKALQRAETAAERFGLRLSPEAYERLGEERRRALRETRRLRSESTRLNSSHRSLSRMPSSA